MGPDSAVTLLFSEENRLENAAHDFSGLFVDVRWPHVG